MRSWNSSCGRSDVELEPVQGIEVEGRIGTVVRRDEGAAGTVSFALDRALPRARHRARRIVGKRRRHLDIGLQRNVSDAEYRSRPEAGVCASATRARVVQILEWRSEGEGLALDSL